MIYETPVLEILTFESEDIIETSNPVARFVPDLPEDWFTDSL